jgi:hypothetical protein
VEIIPIPVLTPMPGTVAIIPDPATPATAAVLVEAVEAMVEEEMAVAAAAIRQWPTSRAAFSAAAQELLDSFQTGSTPVWNHLKQRFFLLHPAAVLNI